MDAFVNLVTTLDSEGVISEIHHNENQNNAQSQTRSKDPTVNSGSLTSLIPLQQQHNWQLSSLSFIAKHLQDPLFLREQLIRAEASEQEEKIQNSYMRLFEKILHFIHNQTSYNNSNVPDGKTNDSHQREIISHANTILDHLHGILFLVQIFILIV